MMHSPAPPMTPRQRAILLAVVREHIATKTPVGSKQLRENHGFTVSSATIRNEMAYLEKAGYLRQPHTSAGRVPMPVAFRLYVNQLDKQLLPEHADAIRIYDNECRRLKSQPRSLMRATSRSLAALTGCPGIVMSPSQTRDRFAQITVTAVSSHTLLLTYITDTGKEVQQLLRSPEPMTFDQIKALSRALDRKHRGRAIGQLSTLGSSDLAAAFPGREAPEALVQELRRAVEGEDDRELYVDGTSYILGAPGFEHSDSLRDFIATLDQHAVLREALIRAAENIEVTITIGGENRIRGIHPCSLVARPYAATGLQAGAVAVLGPMCMDYQAVVSVVTFVAETLDAVLPENANGPSRS